MVNKSILVLADGNFDGLHFGHIEHLQAARTLGDRLVVALATDEVVAQRKGPGRPRFPAVKRREMLEALRFVDDVIITDDSLRLIGELKPVIYVKGKEYETGGPDHAGHQRRVELVESYGGRVVYTDTMMASSSAILNSHYPPSQPVADFLTSIKAKHTLDEINGWLDRMMGLSVLVVGETIQDVYQEVSPQGKSPKDSLVVWALGNERQWDGGARAVFDHLEGLGLKPVYDWDTPRIIKRRFVWGPQQTKVFSIIERDGVPAMRKCLPDRRDFTLVADFGHGLINKAAADMLAYDRKEFLALTCQSNASNWGYNLLTKWPRADYIVADEDELRLAAHERELDVEYLIQNEVQRLGARCFALTRGHEGCIISDGMAFLRVPALTAKVVDRLGAGDAFLAATAPLAYLGAPAEIIALVGNVAGAIEVGQVGQVPLDVNTVKRWLKTLLA